MPAQCIPGLDGIPQISNAVNQSQQVISHSQSNHTHEVCVASLSIVTTPTTVNVGQVHSSSGIEERTSTAFCLFSLRSYTLSVCPTVESMNLSPSTYVCSVMSNFKRTCLLRYKSMGLSRRVRLGCSVIIVTMRVTWRLARPLH